MKTTVIIVPVHNKLNYTRKCLFDLHQQNECSFFRNQKVHIIVVDDGSIDGTEEWIKKNYQDVIVLHGDGNLWWSGAINMAVKYALAELHPDYFLLWNNDIEVGEEYFEHLFKIAGSLESDIIVGSKIMVKEHPETIWSMGGYFNPRSGKFGMFCYFKKDGEDYQHIQSANWLTGMGTLIPKNVIESVGYWDNVSFPQYFGDSDFTYRAYLKGYEIQVFPKLILYNVTENSGMNHSGSFRMLIKSLVDIRSKNNLSIKLKFYGLYADSLLAYFPICKFYFKLFGGFLKWKILFIIGIKKSD